MDEAPVNLIGSDGPSARISGPTVNPLELTILMPCLDEAESVAGCIEEALDFLERSCTPGEVLIADNGSTDGSVAIAQAQGARVVHVAQRGYGGALLGGLQAARGTYVIMGDADGSYDFGRLEHFVQKLRSGSDLVIGNRFEGGIAPGSMPAIHRYFGNPLLSLVGRLFFPPGVRDFHCGLRGVRRDVLLALGLRTLGMEFASEMVVRAQLAKLHIAEVPTTLRPDRRSRPPHLRTWRDGWRTLRLLFLLSPRWLFLYPGIAILAFGLALTAILLPGPVSVAPQVTLDIHTFIVGCLALLVGSQCISFAFVSRRYATSRGFLPPQIAPAAIPYSLEGVLIGAALVICIGLLGIAYCAFEWASSQFGAIEYPGLVRILLISCTLVALAMQVALTASLAALLEIGR